MVQNQLVFRREHALEAIRRARENGIEWLYNNYPKHGGLRRESTTGFLVYDGEIYPVKPLGRLANQIAGFHLYNNPITNVFRTHFEKIGFDLISSLQEEAEAAVARSRRLAEVWARPGQAKFRCAVFNLLGPRCLITDCTTIAALEVAHILPVARGGSDEGWNGIPLRADIHRLFDCDLLKIDILYFNIIISPQIFPYYQDYSTVNISNRLKKSKHFHQYKMAFCQRYA